MSLSALLLMLPLAVSPEGATPNEKQVRAAIVRSIPYLEEKGVWWINEKKCVTCHRTGNMVWSLGAARQKGFAVSDKLEEWFTWSIEKSLAKNAQGQVDGASNKEGVAQLLLARGLFASQEDRTESYRQLAGLLAEGQQADGAWKPGGQLPAQKRAAVETADATTIWLALALAELGGDNHRGELDKAVGHIQASKPGASTEWYAVRLLLASRLGDAAGTSSMVEKLRSQQQPGGGWGWIVGEESDALGTGLAIYALLRAGVQANDLVIERGQQFLISTQREDGSWPVHGTKANKKSRIEETAVYWGTAWATLALVESLPESSRDTSATAAPGR